MHPVKRIELLADSVEMTKILEGLHKAGVAGHTVIRNVVGKSPGADATQLDNVYVIAFCMPEQVKPVVENIKPILNKFGGACYISDAMEIRSVRCVASL
jgi:nitrogen regulatory protein PII